MADETNLVEMTIEVVASYVAHNNLRPSEVPDFIAQTHAAIAALTAAPEPEPAVEEAAPAEHQPAVTVRKSLASREHIISLIDGKPYKTLKRHLARHGMTPAEYRQRYGLKADYPMTAPAYSEQRREVAKTLGLGRKAVAVVAHAAAAVIDAVVPSKVEAEPAKPKRGRKAAAAPATAATAPAAKRGRPGKVRTADLPEETAARPEPMFE
jgi:predicted transcriptional regulator